MIRIRTLICALCVGAVFALPAGVAVAKPPLRHAGNTVIADCYRHNSLTRRYTTAELKHALAVMPAYVKQYSSCEMIIQNAINDNVSGLHDTGAGGGGGSSISTALVIVIVVVVAAIVTFGGLLIRRRRALARDDRDPDLDP